MKEVDNEENPFEEPITLYEEALVTSLYSLGIAIGPVIFNRLADVMGRKWFLISISTIEFSCFMLLAFARNICYFYAARLIQGMGAGSGVTVLTLFITEIADNNNRGKCGTLSNVFQSIGNTYGYIISIFQMRMFTLLCTLPFLMSIPLFIVFIPESPIYLVQKGKRDDARNAIRKFRNIDFTEAGKVLVETENLITETSQSDKGLLTLLKKPGFRKALVISNGLFVFLQLTGLFAVLGYLHNIFSLANVPISQDTSSIFISAIQTVSNFMSTIFIEKLGRKLLLMFSSLTIALSLLLLGTYFQLKSGEFLYIDRIAWLPIVSISILVIGYGIGLGPVTFVLMSELFSPDFKTRASSVALFSSGVASFAVVYTFPVVRDLLGISWCFWILQILTLLGLLFIYLMVEETKGKSFLEIQQMLHKNSLK